MAHNMAKVAQENLTLDLQHFNLTTSLIIDQLVSQSAFAVEDDFWEITFTIKFWN